MKKVIVSIAMISASFWSAAQTDIANARTFGAGQTVTVHGVATNGSELGSIRYMQDNTAGIAGFGGMLSGVNRYDSISITGPLIEFSGLLEISTVTNVVNHGPAVITPVAQQLPITSFNESKESQLAQVLNVTFVQSGVFAGNTTYQVTDGANTLDVRVNTSTNIDGTAIPTGPISITGLVGQFNANYQIVPRDLNDIVTYIAPAFEINVQLAGSTALHNSNYFIGSTTSLNVTIENQGSTDLIISGANFSGVNAADFSTTIGATTIGGLSSQAFTITYTPSGTGSRFATLQVGSNDTDENPYIINFEAVGTDNLATEPTGNPSTLNFSNVKAYTLSGTYNAGTGATKYLVLRKTGSAITGVPVDGNTYLRGDVVGDANVAYVGAGTSFTPRGVIANQDYYYAVYAFNGEGGFENYLTTSPLINNVTSGGSTAGSYYSGISELNSTLISDLTSLISPHQFISYFNYKQTIMNEFELKDTIGGDSYVTCSYSGDRTIFNGAFDWQTSDYSREHVFAHSWMPTFPADSPEEKEYTDLHNLFPVQFSQVNAVRSNYPLGEVVTVQSSYLGSKIGLNAQGQKVFEPRDDIKGNAARALMYMSISYNGQSGVWAFPSQISFAILYGQDQEVIKEWHFTDLPDNYEIARNEYVNSTQGNRNPFIDNVDYACYIDFSNMTYNSNGCLASVNELSNEDLSVYPNPSNNDVQISFNDGVIVNYTIVDLQGREVASMANLNSNNVILNVANFNSGSYIVSVETSKGIAQRKLIVE